MRLDKQKIFTTKRYAQLFQKIGRELEEKYQENKRHLELLDGDRYYYELDAIDNWYDAENKELKNKLDRRTTIKLVVVKKNYCAEYRSFQAALAAAKLIGGEIF